MKRRDLSKSLRRVAGGSLCSGSDFFGDGRGTDTLSIKLDPQRALQ
jgi:hypothetical protein